MTFWLSALISVFAGISTIAGVIVLECFFREKLKDLFDDSNYFIFFFLVFGYVLYSLGEVSYFLGNTMFVGRTAAGIEDLYWTIGMIVIFISFLGLIILQVKKSQQSYKILYLLLTGAVLLLISYLIVDSSEFNFFNHFYLIMSCVLVSVSLVSVFYSKTLGSVARPLKFFLAASVIFLISQIMFELEIINVSTTFEMSFEVLYLLGYVFSTLAFITFKSKLISLSNR